MSLRITELVVKDIRFPTSRDLAGSDAMNVDPDYSAAYVILKTNQSDLHGHGLTFTIGRGNELCVAAVRALAPRIVGTDLLTITSAMGDWWHEFTGDSQLRWLGPDKGVMHLATAAVVNAVWDLWGKVEKKPVWRLLADMSPEDVVNCIDFSYITDAIEPDEAVAFLERKLHGKEERIDYLQKNGYPAYTTSAGWLGYSDVKLQDLCRDAVKAGWKHIKIKVGRNLQEDVRRCALVREAIGPHVKLMLDANQKWDVDEAVAWMRELSPFAPWWIEEPTSPDDVLGHAHIRSRIRPIKVASGEHCQNRVVFKQFLQAGAVDFCQIDACRLGGINEVLAVMLMAGKFEVPICPHAGGVGLCEYVQHLAMFDYIAVSGMLENRMIEYVDHLHQHFVHPVVLKGTNYLAPKAPGYSITMKDSTLADFDFECGTQWRTLRS